MRLFAANSDHDHRPHRRVLPPIDPGCPISLICKGISYPAVQTTPDSRRKWRAISIISTIPALSFLFILSDFRLTCLSAPASASHPQESEEVVVSSKEAHVPDHSSCRKDITLCFDRSSLRRDSQSADRVDRPGFGVPL